MFRLSRQSRSYSKTNLILVNFAASLFSTTTILGPMRPQAVSRSRATCSNFTVPRRTLVGVHNITTATQTTPLRCTRRPVLQTVRSSPQIRCITQNYLRRMKEGEEEWARHAQEIKAGTRKDFATHLEERGLIHDVVGYVRLFSLARSCIGHVSNWIILQ